MRVENKRRIYLRDVPESCRWLQKWWRMPLSCSNGPFQRRSWCSWATASHPSTSFNLPDQWKPNDKANEWDLQNKEKIASKKSSRKKHSLIRIPQSRDDGEFPHRNALSPSAPPSLYEVGKGKYTRWVPNKAQCRRVAMPVIRSSNHLQDTQKSNPRQKSLYSNSSAKAHELQWGGHLS